MLRQGREDYTHKRKKWKEYGLKTPEEKTGSLERHQKQPFQTHNVASSNTLQLNTKVQDQHPVRPNM